MKGWGQPLKGLRCRPQREGCGWGACAMRASASCTPAARGVGAQGPWRVRVGALCSTLRPQDTWTWREVETPAGEEVPQRRDMATLTEAGGGLLLLFGGRLESGRATGDAWVFDTNK